jgi:hypothetical protein
VVLGWLYLHHISAFLAPWDHNGAFDYSPRLLIALWDHLHSLSMAGQAV